jgi:hypothetical protein
VGVVLWQAHDLEAVVISGVNLTVGLSSKCMPPPRNIKLNIQYSTDLQKCSCLKRDFMYVRFQVLTAASMMFRAVFWVVLPCK